MGRIDTDATQYHQGLQFQESHQTPPETIDDAPPVDEDLYEPPSNYQRQPAGATTDQYPPPQDHHPAAAVHSFPPPQEYNKPPPAQPFPPAYTNEKSTPAPAQAFPPPQEQTPQHFPSPNQYMHHQQQQQAPPQFPAAQHQPGIPVGYSPSPFNQQQITQFPTEPWKTSLFDCMRNPQNAIITLFFPCVTFGQIAEIVDAGNTSCGTSGMLYSLILCCIAMPCIMSCTYRTKLRSKYGLIESPAPDWVIHCFCEYCALCQEYRELEERGFDPAIGWMGNMAKQQQGQQQFGMTPPMHQRMM